jgi:cell wall-associated NlpC family hydrolase
LLDRQAPLSASNRVQPGVHRAHRGRFLLGMLAVATLLTSGLAEPVSARASATSAATEVIAAARRHIGAPYRFGSDGPRTFDCSGLVFRAFKEAHEAGAIGRTRKTAVRYMRAFELRGQASRSNGRPGDLVVYGGGSHIGIYLGHGKVISALASGVRRHGLRRLTIPFTEFLHTHLTAGR